MAEGRSFQSSSHSLLRSYKPAWRNNYLIANRGNEHDKASDVWEPDTLWNDARRLVTFLHMTAWLLSWGARLSVNPYGPAAATGPGGAGRRQDRVNESQICSASLAPGPGRMLRHRRQDRKQSIKLPLQSCSQKQLGGAGQEFGMLLSLDVHKCLVLPSISTIVELPCICLLLLCCQA